MELKSGIILFCTITLVNVYMLLLLFKYLFTFVGVLTYNKLFVLIEHDYYFPPLLLVKILVVPDFGPRHKFDDPFTGRYMTLGFEVLSKHFKLETRIRVNFVLRVIHKRNGNRPSIY